MSNNEADVHFSAANRYVARKKYQLAYRELHSGLAIEPASYHGHFWLGYVAGKLGYNEECAKERQYLLNGYGCFESVNDYSKFVLRSNVSIPSPAFKDAFSLLQGLATADFKVGRKSHSSSLLRQSLMYFNQVLAFDPDYSWIATMCAWCHVEMKEYDLAEKILRAETVSHPNLVAPYLMSARLSYRQGRFLKVITMFCKGMLALFKNFDLNVKSQRSRFHFASEVEAKQYFTQSFIHPSPS